MQRMFLAGWFFPACLAVSAQTPRPADSTNFALHSGDTVVFYGDSIDMRRVELRLEIDGADAATLDGIRRYEAQAENSVYEAAKPRLHQYELVRIDPQL